MDVPLKDARLFVEINDMLLFKINNTNPSYSSEMFLGFYFNIILWQNLHGGPIVGTWSLHIIVIL